MSRYAVTLAGFIAVMCLGSVQVGWAAPTPPVMPTVVETPLPAPVTLPAPETIPADVPNQPLEIRTIPPTPITRSSDSTIGSTTRCRASASRTTSASVEQK